MRYLTSGITKSCDGKEKGLPHQSADWLAKTGGMRIATAVTSVTGSQWQGMLQELVEEGFGIEAGGTHVGNSVDDALQILAVGNAVPGFAAV